MLNTSWTDRKQHEYQGYCSLAANIGRAIIEAHNFTGSLQAMTEEIKRDKPYRSIEDFIF